MLACLTLTALLKKVCSSPQCICACAVGSRYSGRPVHVIGIGRRVDMHTHGDMPMRFVMVDFI